MIYMKRASPPPGTKPNMPEHRRRAALRINLETRPHHCLLVFCISLVHQTLQSLDRIADGTRTAGVLREYSGNTGSL